MGRLFGTDGVRGVVGQDMNSSFAFRLAYAAGQMLRSNNHRRAVVVGRDTRESGEMLEQAVAEGFSAAGLDVWLAGIITTPGVAFLTSSLGEAAGVVISASHNPHQYNGIKLFSPLGQKFPDEQEDEISRIFYSLSDSLGTGTAGRGKILSMNKAEDKYIAFLSGIYGDSLRNMKVVLDCANGAAYKIAPRLLESLGAQTVCIGNQPDGKNINADCGALHMERLRELTQREGSAAGLALDGDADRALFIDEQGRMVDGDHVLAMMAREMKPQGRLRGDKVVGTTMSNLGLSLSLQEIGCELLRAPVGDRYVLELMQKEDSSLGGEPSGHVIFLDRASTGDGLLTGLAVLELMAKKDVPLSELAAVMRHFPQVMLNLSLRDNKSWQEDEYLLEEIARIESDLGEEGRIIVRASGTEPLVRIMVEGTDHDRISAMAQGLAEKFTERYGL